MSQGAAQLGAEDCYRHPGRPSWVLCQRCGRAICPACQVDAAVGKHCPECVEREQQWQRDQHIQQRRAQGQSGRMQRWLGRPQAMTLSIIGVTALVSLLAFVLPPLSGVLAFQSHVGILQPWRLITATLVHGGLLHLFLNMWALYALGPAVEEGLGKARFLALYLVTAAAGSVAVALFGSTSWVVGASGAVFGLFGVYLGLQRSLAKVDPGLLILVGINLVYGFVVSGIAWQAHLGGLVAGFLIGYGTVWLQRRRGRKAGAAAWLAIGITGAITAALWIGWLAFQLVG